MNDLILQTSGSTSTPKEISHSWEWLDYRMQQSIDEIKLTDKDIVLDVFPSNVIAHYTVTAGIAKKVGARLITTTFNPYSYCTLFNKYRPTYVSLIPAHLRLLEASKEWQNIDLSCVRYFVTGSTTVSQEQIDSLRSKGAQLVANWYGLTEMPPPVMVAYNSESFDFSAPKKGYTLEFTDQGELVINGFHTGDLFDVTTSKFLRRIKDVTNTNSWKS